MEQRQEQRWCIANFGFL
uniref:Uncharacterized protein n=1 Tax=Arundo donax TaxID=35708 RepID=A0A0A9BWD0_ARUDO